MSSSRLAIGQALQAFLAGVQNPNTNQPLFALSKLGNVYDATGFSSFIEVTYHRGNSQPVGSGGNMVGWRIDESLQWMLSAGWEYTSPSTLIDSTDAVESMLTAMDILVPAIHQHFQLPQASNSSLPVQSVYSVLVDPQDRSRLVIMPNGSVYLMWDLMVLTKQQYSIQLIQP